MVSERSPDETVTGSAHNQRALAAGLARRGIDCVATPADAAIAADAVMLWGGRAFAAGVVARARARCIPTIHQIRTPSLHDVARLGWSGTAAVAADERAVIAPAAIADLVLVPSAFMADYWAARLGVRPEVMHPIVEPDRVRAARRGARYVTFINPEPGKGLGMFWRIAVEARDRMPHLRFLVVEGRWGAADVARAGIAPLCNVRFAPHDPDVRRIWARTRVLLVPSVMPEAFGMVVQEAHLLGIPVIASRLAGLPEAANGAGTLLDPPARCVADWTDVPTRAEVRPWLAALAALDDRAAVVRARRRAIAAARRFEPDRILDAVATRLHTLVAAHRRGRGAAA